MNRFHAVWGACVALLVIACGAACRPICVVSPNVAQGTVEPLQQSPAQGDPDVKLIESLPTRIDWVLTGATWCQENAMGSYRLIALRGGFEEVYHNLYLQLIRADPIRKELEVVKTIPIGETLGLSLVIQEMSLKPASSGLCTDAVVEAVAVRRLLGGERRERLRVRVTQCGDYEITFEPLSARGKAD